MRVSKFSIATPDLNRIVNYLVENLPFDYENHSANMSVLALEKYYFRNNSTQLNMIIAKQRGTDILIDVLAGAGGTGFLNFNFRSEKNYVDKVQKVLEKYTTEFDLILVLM